MQSTFNIDIETHSQKFIAISNHLTWGHWFRVILLGSLMIAQIPLVSAQTYNQVFQRPSFRNKPDTQWATWDHFQNAVGNNSPDVKGSTGSAVINQTASSGVILTGSGNIYGLNNPPKFILTDAVPYALTRVVLQIRIVGNNINIPGVVLKTGGASYKPAVSVLETGDANSPYGGGAYSTKFTWNLAGTQNYSIEFNGIEPHTSLDAVSLDTAGPLPGSFITQFDSVPNILTDKAEALLTGSVLSLTTVQKVQLRRAQSSNWIPAILDPTNNAWSIQMPLEYGENIIHAQAINTKGKKSKKTTLILYRVLVR